MKKNIIALAIASAIAAPIAMADAPVVYGIANMAIQNNAYDKPLATGKDAGTTVDSIASRVGIKGSEDLGNGLKAIYKMEFGVNIDGSKDGLSARNQYVGLAGGFGTVLLGTHDTPLKMSQPKDLFNDGLADNGKVSNVLLSGGEVRADNVLAYVSPSFSGVKIVAATVAGANDSDNGLEDETPTATDKSELAHGYSVAAMYGSTKKGLYLAAAFNGGELFETATPANKSRAETRLSAQYATGGLIANVMYQTQDNVGSAIIASAGYKMGKFMPKVKWADTSETDNSGADGTVTSLGLNYSLGKKTTAYVEYSMFDEDFVGVDADYASTALGLQHKF